MVARSSESNIIIVYSTLSRECAVHPIKFRLSSDTEEGFVSNFRSCMQSTQHDSRHKMREFTSIEVKSRPVENSN